jgi:hypothetical protein
MKLYGRRKVKQDEYRGQSKAKAMGGAPIKGHRSH